MSEQPCAGVGESAAQSLTAPGPDCVVRVDVGGATMALANPWGEERLMWHLTWGNPIKYRHVAVSVIDSYDYLLSDMITAKEAIRRLRILRAKRKELRP